MWVDIVLQYYSLVQENRLMRCALSTPIPSSVIPGNSLSFRMDDSFEIPVNDLVSTMPEQPSILLDLVPQPTPIRSNQSDCLSPCASTSSRPDDNLSGFHRQSSMSSTNSREKSGVQFPVLPTLSPPPRTNVVSLHLILS